VHPASRWGSGRVAERACSPQRADVETLVLGDERKIAEVGDGRPDLPEPGFLGDVVGSDAVCPDLTCPESIHTHGGRQRQVRVSTIRASMTTATPISQMLPRSSFAVSTSTAAKDNADVVMGGADITAVLSQGCGVDVEESEEVVLGRTLERRPLRTRGCMGGDDRRRQPAGADR
jgi:hypothetical protein